MTLTIGSLFSGYGGLDLGVRSVLGGTVAWHSDIKPAACKLLEHRYPDVPNLGDITRVDWRAIRTVDVLTGGFPCTDISTAGKQTGLIRRGAGKTRSGLWAEMCRAVDILRPSLMVAENVRAICNVGADSSLEPCPWCVGNRPDEHLRALGAVLGDLADIGYDAAWLGVPASRVGAPHARWRIFIAAWPAAARHTHDRADDQIRALQTRRDSAEPGGAWSAAADAEDERRARSRGARNGWARSQDGSRRPADDADADGARRESRRRVPAGPVARYRRPGPADSAAARRAAADADRRRLEIVGRIDTQRRDADGRRRADQARHAAEPASRLAPFGAAADATQDGRDLRTQDAARVRIGEETAAAHRQADSWPPERWGRYRAAVERWGTVLGRPAPPPLVTNHKGAERLSPRLTEWMMGLPDGWICDVPNLTRNEKLSLAGDGVVPQQAAHALRILLAARDAA